MNWRKIDWKKIEELVKENATVDKDDEFYYGSAAENILGRKEIPFTEFTWEDAFKAGLPLKDPNKLYLVYFADSETFDFMMYDDENNTPCFWTDVRQSEVGYPDAWIPLEEVRKDVKKIILVLSKEDK